MADPAFLEEGEWCGYYAYAGPTTPVFDPAMRNIKFHVNLDGQAKDKYAISAVGEDSVGRFTLEGHIYNVDGMALLRKTYISAHSWMWWCHMTPFGLFGRWGWIVDERPLGWVWLWKSSWTDGSRR